MIQLATHGMPAGAGRKGGRAPKKKSHSSVQPTDENRVPLTCIISHRDKANPSNDA